MKPRSLTRRALLRHAVTGGAALLAACAPAAQATPTPDPTPTGPPMPTTTPTKFIPPELPEDQRALAAVTGVEQIAQIAGEDSINGTGEKWKVYGTDLGHMFDKDGKLYMVFGDTFGCCPPGSGGPGNAPDWRYNVMAVSTDRDPSDGITFDEMITDEPGHAKQLVARFTGDTTLIPTNGIAVGGTMYLHYMAVLSWGAPGEWTLSGAGLATSDDDGQTWERDTVARWDGKSNFGQVAFVKHEASVYLFGIPGGRFGSVKLARVLEDSLLERSAYRYYTGQDGAGWSENEADAVAVVPLPVGELSVIWNAYLNRWIMTYLDERKAAIVIREAPELWGPWSAALPLVSSQGFPGLYGAYMHPWYVENEGQSIYFTMSQWGPYAVFWMRADLAKNGS